MKQLVKTKPSIGVRMSAMCYLSDIGLLINYVYIVMVCIIKQTLKVIILLGFVRKK